MRPREKMEEHYSKTAKYGLLTVSFLVSAVAIIILLIAAWMCIDRTFFISITEQDNNFVAGMIIIFIVGICLLIVSILGCVGALKRSRCCLVFFFGILLVNVVAQVSFAGWTYVNKDLLNDTLRSSVINTVKYEYGETECRTQVVDVIQSSLECCGATGPADWAGSKYSCKDLPSPLSGPLSLTVSNDDNVMFIVPDSCCKNASNSACAEDRKMKVAGIVNPNIYSEGCTDKLVIEVNDQACYILLTSLVILGIEIFGMIFALITCSESRLSDRYKA